MANAQHVISVDDERVRVTTWTFQDGEDTGHHRHEFDYIVVPVSGGRFEITENDGSVRNLEQRAGAPYLGRAGTEHNITSRSGAPAVFVEIELKA